MRSRRPNTALEGGPSSAGRTSSPPGLYHSWGASACPRYLAKYRAATTPRPPLPLHSRSLGRCPFTLEHSRNHGQEGAHPLLPRPGTFGPTRRWSLPPQAFNRAPAVVLFASRIFSPESRVSPAPQQSSGLRSTDRWYCWVPAPPLDSGGDSKRRLAQWDPSAAFPSEGFGGTPKASLGFPPGTPFQGCPWMVSQGQPPMALV